MAYISFQPKEYFAKILTLSGTSATRAVTYGETTDVQPDLVWAKSRSDAYAHQVCDSVRGVTKIINPNTTAAEQTVADSLTAFGTDGFTMGSGGDWNGSGKTYVYWSWKMGTTSGLTGGTITPTAYSISTTAGQSVIAYTGNDTAGATIPHGLGAVPKMIIIKNLISANNWVVYHEALGNTKFLELNTTAAAATATTAFNDTSPTSSVFSVGSSGGVNSGDKAMIAYCFAGIKGYSKFGAYTGNASTDGAFVYTGFRPAYILLKHSHYTLNWYVFDNKREGYNVDNDALFADTADTEGTTDYIDILSNGFKIRSTDNGINGAGNTYIYAAFAENPIVSSNGIPGLGR